MPLPCGVLYAFLLFVQVFSPPAASPNLRRSLIFLRDEVSAVQAKRQPLGLFFLLFFQFFSISFFLFLMALLYILYNFLSAFLSGFFCVFVMHPLFWCVHYGETGSSLAGRCDCGGDEICVLSLKGSLSHPGRLPAAAQARHSRLQKKKVQMAFSGVHIY